MKCLIKLGVSKDKAKRTAYIRAGYWHNSKSIVIHVAILNERLKQKGLLLPIDHYLKYIKYKLNRRIPNCTYGGGRGTY